MRIWERIDPRGGWTGRDVPSDGLAFVEGGLETAVGSRGGALALLVPFDDHGTPRAAVLTPARLAAARVNGEVPIGGLRVLEDRDEITIGGRLYCVTRRTDLDPAPFPEGTDEVSCARCVAPMRTGDVAVRCPGCGSWMHEGDRVVGDARLCWTYAETCVCGLEREGLGWEPGEDGDA